jgi:N-acetylglucosamine kinase-like BadF-type ATPase
VTNTEDCVVGVDAGGTSTRALVAGLDGVRLGTGRAGGANPNSHPPQRAAAQIAEALRAALDGIDHTSVRAGVLGMAGSSKLTDPAVATLFTDAWQSTGLRCPMRVVTDCEVAFAAGTSEPSGTALVAGTGSIAARIEDHRCSRTVGGFGWLLGDEGSGFWLGKQAVRGTLRTLEGGLPLGRLAGSVLAQTLGASSARPETEAEYLDTFMRLITAANAEPPIRLARFAPLVSDAALDGDTLATDIVERAARHLVDTAQAAREPGEGTPVVLIGSLLGAGSPVGTLVSRQLTERFAIPVHLATEGAAGAAWLASLELLGAGTPAAAALHRHLLHQDSTTVN